MKAEASIAGPSTCIVCGGNSHVLLEDFTLRAHSMLAPAIVRCTGCGLGSVHPMPTEAELREIYASPAYLEAYTTTGSTFVLGDAAPAPFIEDRIVRIERLLHGRRGTILDIGSARGAFLRVARDRGWAVKGLELGVESARVAREEYGLDVQTATLSDAAFSDGVFEAVHLSHVLEHLPDPKATIREIRRILKPGGVVALEVPAELGDLFSMLQHRLLRRRPEIHPVPSSHTYFFTWKTLKRLVEDSGFRVRQLRTPRRNRVDESRFPLGRFIKPMVFRAEQWLRMGPNIEIVAVREP